MDRARIFLSVVAFAVGVGTAGTACGPIDPPPEYSGGLNPSGTDAHALPSAPRTVATQPGRDFAASQPPPPRPPPNRTHFLQFHGNLDATAPVTHETFSADSPTETSTYSHDITVYDARGATHVVTVYYCNNGDDAWAFHALVHSAEVDALIGATYYEFANGVIHFNLDGTLNSSATFADTVSFLGATANQEIRFDFGDATVDGGSGTSGVESYADTSAIAYVYQDGHK